MATNPAQLTEAIKIIKQGGIVIYPTDTAFGIGCRIDNELSIKRLFRIRKRPETKAVPVLLTSIDMTTDYLFPYPTIVRQLMETYWPGPLTIVYKCKLENVPSPVRGTGATLGVRIPNHKIPNTITKVLNIPILAPSANFHGEKTPFSINDLNPDLVKLVDGVIEGECSIKAPSTVVDCTTSPFTVIRQGVQIIDNRFLQ